MPKVIKPKTENRDSNTPDKAESSNRDKEINVSLSFEVLYMPITGHSFAFTELQPLFMLPQPKF